jgi:RNA polymerase sigma-70 factor, ECF subfamily
MGDVHIFEWFAPAVPDEGVDWEGVYREEMSRVFNYFRYRGLSRPVAEDLTSTTFEKAWRARSRYRKEKASVATWLLVIARNVAIDHFRRPRAEEPLPDEVSGGGETPESAALRASEARRLRQLLSDLPERERELVALKYGADVTNRAIATLTGLSESNVGTILHRTVLSLRARWDEGGPR